MVVQTLPLFKAYRDGPFVEERKSKRFLIRFHPRFSKHFRGRDGQARAHFGAVSSGVRAKKARFSLNLTPGSCVIFTNPRCWHPADMRTNQPPTFMKKTLQQLLCAALGAVILAATTASAQTTKPKPAEVKTAKATETTMNTGDTKYPFHGTVAAVDTKAKTVSLKKVEGVRILQTDAQTVFEMNDKPATLADIKAGNYLSGTVHKEGGKEEYIIKGKIALEAPARNTGATHKMNEKEKPAVTPAAPATEETATNAPAKKKKKPTTTQ
jgi:Cu/Ag efflux protein CusF